MAGEPPEWLVENPPRAVHSDEVFSISDKSSREALFTGEGHRRVWAQLLVREFENPSL